MGFLSLIIALLVEQVRPLRSHNMAYGVVRGTAEVIERNFNAGEKQQGVLACRPRCWRG
jgi:adenosylcobinamide-phosphate synthase